MKVCRIAALLALPGFLTACATSYTITPIPDSDQEVRYLQGTPTTYSERAGSAIQVTPYGINDEGRLVFGVAAFNKSLAPQNFGVENINVAGPNGENVRVFTSAELQSEAKNRAAWAEFALLMAGAASAAAASENAYRTTSGSVSGPYGTSSFYARTYDPGLAYAGTAAATAGTVYGIAQVQNSLDSTLTRLRGEVLQTTTIDPGRSFGGTSISESLHGDYPRKFSLAVHWGAEQHSFQFVVTKEGQAPPAIPASALAKHSVFEAPPPSLRHDSVAAPQNAVLRTETGSQPTCTHQQEVDARIARMNGYTGGPKCD